MDGPFFTNHRRRHQQPDSYRRPFHPSPSVRGMPVNQGDVHRSAERTTAPKIVQIPVHFVGSEKVDRSGSAIKIQKVFRGFLVRKNLRKIKDIKLQVEEIEERLNKSEIVSLVKRDTKERLRMSESLMALLLKLDSICGVDFGVRGCRKDAIRKAIALQERIDAIVATGSEKEENGENIDLVSEARANDDGMERSSPSVNREDLSCVDVGDRAVDMEVGTADEEDGVVDVGVDCEVTVTETNEDAGNLEIVKEGSNGGRTERELLEKMVEENQKMMSMMTRLFEKNELQTTMLDALTRRVELLEKAFLCDRLRKKMKAKPTASCKN